MNYREQEFNLRISTMRDLYVAGYVAQELARSNGLASEYQLEKAALEKFEDDYYAFEELMRQDIREEEMDLARRDVYEIERELEELARKLEAVEEVEKSRLANKLRFILNSKVIAETVSPNGEEWAHNDGWNAAIEAVREELEEFLNPEATQP